MKYLKLSIVFLVITVYLVGIRLTPIRTDPITTNPNYNVETKVFTPQPKVKILDGDTFILDWERVRLIGIDTPEIQHTAKKADCWAYRSMARLEFYLTTIRDTSEITITRYGQDKYKRTLAVVEIPSLNTSVNEMLVREGYAKPFRPATGIPAPNYDDASNEAIEKQAGNYNICSYSRY